MAQIKIDSPELSALFDGALAEIRASGVEPTDAEIVTLYELARKQLPCSRGTAIIPQSYVVGGVVFHPLTIQATIWLEQYAFAWWDNGLDVVATAWAMTKSGRDTQAGFFHDYTNRAHTWWTLTNWLARLPISFEVLQRVVALALGHKEKIEIDGAKVNVLPSSFEWGDFIATIQAACPTLTREELLAMTEAQVLEMLKYARVDGAAVDDGSNRATFYEMRMLVRSIIGRAKAGNTGTEEMDDKRHGHAGESGDTAILGGNTREEAGG